MFAFPLENSYYFNGKAYLGGWVEQGFAEERRVQGESCPSKDGE